MCFLLLLFFSTFLFFVNSSQMVERPSAPSEVYPRSNWSCVIGCCYSFIFIVWACKCFKLDGPTIEKCLKLLKAWGVYNESALDGGLRGAMWCV